MIPENVKIEARRGGYDVYCNVNYEKLAVEVRDRLNAENARHAATIGLMPDDSWAVWYINRRGVV
jgi:hypothetical protein